MLFKLIGQFVVFNSINKKIGQYYMEFSLDKCNSCKSPLYQNKVQEVYRNKYGVVCKKCYRKLDLIK